MNCSKLLGSWTKLCYIPCLKCGLRDSFWYISWSNSLIPRLVKKSNNVFYSEHKNIVLMWTWLFWTIQHKLKYFNEPKITNKMFLHFFNIWASINQLIVCVYSIWHMETTNTWTGGNQKTLHLRWIWCVGRDWNVGF